MSAASRAAASEDIIVLPGCANRDRAPGVTPVSVWSANLTTRAARRAASAGSGESESGDDNGEITGRFEEEVSLQLAPATAGLPHIAALPYLVCHP